jgi:hypothetical protein
MSVEKENEMKNVSTNLMREKTKECLHIQHTSCIILLKPNAILRRGKRADLNGGIDVRSRSRCPAKVGSSAPLTKCTDVFPQQARENLLTVSEDEHLLNFGKGL